MMNTTFTMEEKEEMVVVRFAEMMEADGYNAWYECEEAWEGYKDRMIEEGLDEEAVFNVFNEMAMDL